MQNPKKITEFLRIPSEAYWNEATFEEEYRKIFSNSWHYVAHVSELPEIGSVKETTLIRDSIFLIKLAPDEYRAFYNICPHRGAPLIVDGKKCSQYIRCPYHSWTFNLDGSLRVIPEEQHYFGELEKNSLSLHGINLQVWKGLIFINFSTSPMPLEQSTDLYSSYLSPYDHNIQDMQLISTIVFDEAINWKLVVENYVEDYHFSFVHPITLGAFDHKGTQTQRLNDHISVYMPYKKSPPKHDSKYAWSSSGGSYQGFIWPTMTLQPAENHLSIFSIRPISPTRTRIEIPVFQTPLQMEKYPLDIDDLTLAITQDMEEDFVICRGMQKSVRSNKYSISVLSNPHESGVKHFAETWWRYINE